MSKPGRFDYPDEGYDNWKLPISEEDTADPYDSIPIPPRYANDPVKSKLYREQLRYEDSAKSQVRLNNGYYIDAESDIYDQFGKLVYRATEQDRKERYEQYQKNPVQNSRDAYELVSRQLPTGTKQTLDTLVFGSTKKKGLKKPTAEFNPGIYEYYESSNPELVEEYRRNTPRPPPAPAGDRDPKYRVINVQQSGEKVPPGGVPPAFGGGETYDPNVIADRKRAEGKIPPPEQRGPAGGIQVPVRQPRPPDQPVVQPAQPQPPVQPKPPNVIPPTPAPGTPGIEQIPQHIPLQGSNYVQSLGMGDMAARVSSFDVEALRPAPESMSITPPKISQRMTRAGGKKIIEGKELKVSEDLKRDANARKMVSSRLRTVLETFDLIIRAYSIFTNIPERAMTELVSSGVMHYPADYKLLQPTKTDTKSIATSVEAVRNESKRMEDKIKEEKQSVEAKDRRQIISFIINVSTDLGEELDRAPFYLSNAEGSFFRDMLSSIDRKIAEARNVANMEVVIAIGLIQMYTRLNDLYNTRMSVLRTLDSLLQKSIRRVVFEAAQSANKRNLNNLIKLVSTAVEKVSDLLNAVLSKMREIGVTITSGVDEVIQNALTRLRVKGNIKKIRDLIIRDPAALLIEEAQSQVIEIEAKAQQLGTKRRILQTPRSTPVKEAKQQEEEEEEEVPLEPIPEISSPLERKTGPPGGRRGTIIEETPLSQRRPPGRRRTAIVPETPLSQMRPPSKGSGAYIAETPEVSRGRERTPRRPSSIVEEDISPSNLPTGTPARRLSLIEPFQSPEEVPGTPAGSARKPPETPMTEPPLELMSIRARKFQPGSRLKNLLQTGIKLKMHKIAINRQLDREFKEAQDNAPPEVRQELLEEIKTERQVKIKEIEEKINANEEEVNRTIAQAPDPTEVVESKELQAKLEETKNAEASIMETELEAKAKAAAVAKKKAEIDVKRKELADQEKVMKESEDRRKKTKQERQAQEDHLRKLDFKKISTKRKQDQLERSAGKRTRTGTTKEEKEQEQKRAEEEKKLSEITAKLKAEEAKKAAEQQALAEIRAALKADEAELKQKQRELQRLDAKKRIEAKDLDKLNQELDAAYKVSEKKAPTPQLKRRATTLPDRRIAMKNVAEKRKDREPSGETPGAKPKRYAMRDEQILIHDTAKNISRLRVAADQKLEDVVQVQENIQQLTERLERIKEEDPESVDDLNEAGKEAIGRLENQKTAMLEDIQKLEEDIVINNEALDIAIEEAAEDTDVKDILEQTIIDNKFKPIEDAVANLEKVDIKPLQELAELPDMRVLLTGYIGLVQNEIQERKKEEETKVKPIPPGRDQQNQLRQRFLENARNFIKENKNGDWQVLRDIIPGFIQEAKDILAALKSEVELEGPSVGEQKSGSRRLYQQFLDVIRELEELLKQLAYKQEVVETPAPETFQTPQSQRGYPATTIPGGPGLTPVPITPLPPMTPVPGPHPIDTERKAELKTSPTAEDKARAYQAFVDEAGLLEEEEFVSNDPLANKADQERILAGIQAARERLDAEELARAEEKSKEYERRTPPRRHELKIATPPEEVDANKLQREREQREKKEAEERSRKLGEERMQLAIEKKKADEAKRRAAEAEKEAAEAQVKLARAQKAAEEAKKIAEQERKTQEEKEKEKKKKKTEEDRSKRAKAAAARDRKAKEDARVKAERDAKDAQERAEKTAKEAQIRAETLAKESKALEKKLAKEAKALEEKALREEKEAKEKAETEAQAALAELDMKRVAMESKVAEYKDSIDELKKEQQRLTDEMDKLIAEQEALQQKFLRDMEDKEEDLVAARLAVLKNLINDYEGKLANLQSAITRFQKKQDVKSKEYKEEVKEVAEQKKRLKEPVIPPRLTPIGHVAVYTRRQENLRRAQKNAEQKIYQYRKLQDKKTLSVGDIAYLQNEYRDFTDLILTRKYVGPPETKEEVKLFTTMWNILTDLLGTRILKDARYIEVRDYLEWLRRGRPAPPAPGPVVPTARGGGPPAPPGPGPPPPPPPPGPGPVFDWDAEDAHVNELERLTLIVVIGGLLLILIDLIIEGIRVDFVLPTPELPPDPDIPTPDPGPAPPPSPPPPDTWPFLPPDTRKPTPPAPPAPPPDDDEGPPLPIIPEPPYVPIYPDPGYHELDRTSFNSGLLDLSPFALPSILNEFRNEGKRIQVNQRRQKFYKKFRKILHAIRVTMNALKIKQKQNARNKRTRKIYRRGQSINKWMGRALPVVTRAARKLTPAAPNIGIQVLLDNIFAYALMHGVSEKNIFKAAKSIQKLLKPTIRFPWQGYLSGLPIAMGQVTAAGYNYLGFRSSETRATTQPTHGLDQLAQMASTNRKVANNVVYILKGNKGLQNFAKLINSLHK